MANIFDLFQKISKQESVSAGPVEYIVAGLGNPGAQYERTRHNAGFLAMDFLAEKYGARIDRAKFHALVGEATIGGKRVLLMKPQTFMNASGEAIAEAARFYKCPTEKIVVISDDFLLDVGRLRVRRKGSAGGHNGIKNIIAHLGTEQFARVRSGVGEKPKDWDLKDYVLGRFTDEEEPLMREALTSTAKACEMFIQGDLATAMNTFNRKKG